MRLRWLAAAAAAEDSVRLYLTAAVAYPGAAKEALPAAAEIMTGGDPEKMKAAKDAELVGMWEKEYGSWDDPATRDKIYAQIAERRKAQAEQAAKAEQAQAKAAAKVRKFKRRRR